MLWWFLILEFATPSYSQASDNEKNHFSIEFVGGSLTYHVVSGDALMYSHKVSADGRLIDNPLYGIGASYYFAENSIYITGRFFKGNNSINQPINGGTFSVGKGFKYLDVGFIIGGYVQNDYDFIKSNVMPFSITPGSNAVVPLIGIELNPKIPLGESFYIKIINILTPLVTNHTLAFGINF